MKDTETNMLFSKIFELEKKVADSSPDAAVAPQTSEGCSEKEHVLKTLHHCYQLALIHDSESKEEQQERTISMINAILHQDVKLSQKEKDLPVLKKLNKMFTKLGDHLEGFSKEDVGFIIQKMTCEKPEHLKKKLDSDIISTINELKEEFGLVEKMEFVQDIDNQVFDLDTGSHQTLVQSEGSKFTMNVTEESKVEK